ncbi:MAG: molecular chaperone DnaJ [Phycisphaerae bacterium]
MPEKRDYYEVLQVERTASADEIKRAYRRGALKYHPDNFRGDKAEGEMKFKELSEAYEVLSDPDKRQRYDQFGHAGLRGAGMHDFSNMGFGDIFSMFSDIFGGMGGVGGMRGGADRGLDLETEVELTLEQVATGTETTLEFERMDLCETCGGSGAKPGTNPEKCSTCGGYGQVQQQMQGFFGLSIRVINCPDCNGKGTLVKNPCPDCNGSGRGRIRRTLTVHVPAGVQEGQVIRIRGEGEPNRSGTDRGDLHVYVRIQPHPLLTRRGQDLICQLPISYSQAALGGKVEVPILNGTEEVDIPAGTQNGDVFTIKGKGLPSMRTGKPGEEFVQVHIEVPTKLTDEQRELLEKYAETEDVRVTPKRKSFIDKFKEYFAALNL